MAQGSSSREVPASKHGALPALIFVALLALASTAAAAPAPPPRAADGHPDLSGVWTNASVTKLTRPPGMTKSALTAAEAAALAKSNP